MQSDTTDIAAATSSSTAQEPIIVQGDPTFKEKVMGEALAMRGALTGDKEKQIKGEQMKQGVNAPSTDRKIEEATGQKIDDLNIHRPTGGMKGSETEGRY